MCVPAGTPLSIFRGRVQGDGEPWFTDDDRRWALAWRHDQDVRLPCGCHPDDVSGPDKQDSFDAVPHVCHRHYAVDLAAEKRSKSEADSMHGVWFQTHRVDDD